MEEEIEDNLLFLAAAAECVTITKRRRRRRFHHQRRFWARQWLQSRKTERGMMHFVDELRDDMSGFQGFLHMSSQEFNHLLLIITPQLQKTDTFMRDSISAKEMLVVALRYLASGECMYVC